MPRGPLRLWWGAWFVGLATVAAAAEFRVVGTDLLGLEFTREFSAHAARQGATLRLALDGSRSGLTAVSSGRADFALIASASEEATLPAGLKAVTFAYHVVVVLVPSECPVNAITTEQLAVIFGAPVADAGVKLPRWGELGAIGEWNGAPITPVAPDAGTGITAELFRKIALRGGNWRPQVQRFATVAELQDHLSGQSRAIALASGMPAAISGKMKTLPVARTSRTPTVAPSAESVHSGAYPFRLPVQAVFRLDRAQEFSALLGYLVSREAAGVFERASLVPLPAEARAGILQGSDLIEKPPK